MLFPLHDTSAIALEFRIFWCKGTVKIHAELWRGCQRQLWLEDTEAVPEGAVWVCTGVSPADGWWDGLLQLPCMGRMKCPGWASLWQLRQERCSLEHLPASARGQLLSLLVLWKSKAAKLAHTAGAHCSDLTAAQVRHTKFITAPKILALKYKMMAVKNKNFI